MKHWINNHSEVDNFVLLTDHSLVIGSCDEEHIASFEKKLLAGDSHSDVFGSDNFVVITLSQILKLVIRSTDSGIDIDYKLSKEEESKLLDFESTEKVNEFVSAIEPYLSERLKKKEYQQSIVAAGLPSVLSLITAVGISAMYINKFRWLTLIIGGIWALASLYRLFTRVSNPPLITQWSSRNVAGEAWSRIKMAGSLAVVALIVFAFSTRFPNTHGEMAFVEHMNHEELEADDVASLVKNGGDINRISRYGYQPLHYAVYYEDLDLFKKLLENGADPSIKDEQDADALDEAVYQNEIEMAHLLLTKHSGKLALEGRLNGYIQSSVTPKMLSTLFNNGINPTEQDGEGNNALQTALIAYADYEVVSTLIEHKVPTNVNIDGRSLKQYALDNDQDDVARLFNERSLSFERERQLTQKIDGFYAKKIKERLSKTTGLTKLIVNAQDLDDEDTQEMIEEWSKIMQYQSLSAAGNQRVVVAYVSACERSGFNNIDKFKEGIDLRARKLKGHIQVSNMILERNRSVFNEGKGEFVTPSDYQARVDRAINKIEDAYLNSEEDDKLEEFNKKCEDVYTKTLKRRK